MNPSALRRTSGARWKAAAAVSVCALALAACSTSSDSDSSADPGTKDSSAAPSADGVSQDTIDIALKYTGGTAGKADESLDPVVIGYTNQEGGVPSFPGQTKVAEATVKFINENLGGVDGHPLELDKCLIQAEEDGQKCASQFLADPAIKLANLSVSVVGNGPFYDLINGKFPVIVSVVGAEADYVSKHVYEFDGGGPLTMDAQASDVIGAGAKTVAVIASDNPAGKFITSKVKVPAIEKGGARTKVAYVSDSGTTPDYVSALQSIDAANADAIDIGPATPQGCIAAYQAMQQLNITGKFVSSSYACMGDPVPEALNGGPDGFVVRTLASNPLLDTPEVVAYRDAMTVFGAKDSINGGNTQKAFSDMLTIVKLSNEIGYDNLTPAAYEDAIMKFRGPAYMVPGDIQCGYLADFPGTCGKATAGSEFTDGKWVPVDDYVTTN